jgi:hypothetical protein
MILPPILTILDSGAFDTGHFLETLFAGLGAGAVFFTAFWGFHRQDKKEREEQEEKKRTALLSAVSENEKKTEERHRENQDVLIEITSQLKYLPPHCHSERDGPLTVDGITYKPRNGR